MPFEIESPHFHFILNQEASTWSLYGTRMDAPSLEDVWMRANYSMGLPAFWKTGKRKFQFLEKWYKPRISRPRDTDSPHGQLKLIEVEMGPDLNGIGYQLEFALSQQYPLFLCRLALENRGRQPVEVEDLELVRAGFFPKRHILPNPGPLSVLYKPKPIGYGVVRPNPDPGELGFFSNGWQSWSYTGAYVSEDIYRSSRLGFFAEMMWYASGRAPKRKPGYFTSDMFGVVGDRVNRTGILAGFLSQKQHFGAVEASIADPLYPAIRLWVDGDRARLDPGASVTTDWAVIQFLDLDDPDPLAPYLEAVAREHQIPSSVRRRSASAGWCSWYYFFTDIDQVKIRANLDSAAGLQESLPLQIFQIDDGFESKIGDWLSFSPGFPDGLVSLADEIKEAGLTPGLWFAPFITHSRSKIASDHRDWLLRNRLGLPVNAGFVWNNFNRALDLTNPGAMAYVRHVIHTAVRTWGFPYLKLDFLYAAALKGRYRDRTKTRAQVLRSGLELIRETAGPEVILLGCGVPLGSAIGIFDAMRIGTDVDPHWEPNLYNLRALFHSEPNLPSTRNALQNTITRVPFHKRWWVNDPDCLLVRPDSKLSLAEVQTLATAIAITGGSLLLSDDLPQLPIERMRIAAQLLPVIGERPRVMDWFDSATPRLLRLDLGNQTGKWHLLAVFNWGTGERDIAIPLVKFALPPGDYFAREFWRGRTTRVTDGILSFRGVPGHGVGLFSLRPIAGQTAYLGSDLHISQGLEVTDWSEAASDGVRFQLERPGKASGMLDLYLPRPPGDVLVSKGEVEWHSLGDQCYRLRVLFERRISVEIL